MTTQLSPPRPAMPEVCADRHDGVVKRHVPRVAVFSMAAALMLAAAPLAPSVVPGSAKPAAAQDIQRIAAVVNQDAISLRDIITRMDFIIVTSNLPDSQETRQRLLPQVLESLITESIRLQEAERLDIEVSDTELADGIRQVEQQNNLQPGTLRQQLQQAGVPFTTFERQVRSEIAWIKVVTSSLAGRVTVSEAEIDARLEQLEEVKGKEEALLAQIYLPVEDPTRENEVRPGRGASGTADCLGRQFPGIGAAVQPRPLRRARRRHGWVPLPTLEPELREAVARTPQNRITAPIRTTAGYTILLVRDKRIAGQQPQGPQGIDLAQIMLPTTGARALSEERRATLTEQAQATRSCDRLCKAGGKCWYTGLGAARPNDPG